MCNKKIDVGSNIYECKLKISNNADTSETLHEFSNRWCEEWIGRWNIQGVLLETGGFSTWILPWMAKSAGDYLYLNLLKYWLND